MNIKGIQIVLALLFIAVISACSGPGTPVPQTGVEQTAGDPMATQAGDAPMEGAPSERVETLRLSSDDFGFPSPFAYSRGPGYARMSLIFDSLVWKDSTGEMIPWLAESWESSPDGLTWDFTIRQEVMWHDGRPLTADDVVFSYLYSSEQPGTTLGSVQGLLHSVEKTGENEVRIVLERPYAPFLRNVLAAVPIIPQHIWENVEDARQFTTDEALIGSGAYRLVTYDKAEGAYLYDANDDYWMGPPYVKRIEMIRVGDDSLALSQGEIHAGGIEGITSAAMEDLLNVFTKDERFGIITAPGEWNLVLYFNMERGAPFHDKAFRQAVAYALDLEMVVNQVLFGDGLPGRPGQLPPSNPAMNPEAKTYPYDPALARQMLEEAGYVDRNGDGIRETPDGEPLRIELLYANWYSPRPAEMIKTWLQEVGIEINLKLVDRATSDQYTSEGQYEMALVGFGGRGGDPDTLRGLFSSKSRSQSFTKVFGFKNDLFDELADKQLMEMDEQTRLDLVYQMQAILAEEVPTIPLYYPSRTHIYDQTVLDAWYFTPGGFGGAIPMAWNKHIFITGQQTGLTIKGH
jgi:peptide/nickel transport system substrate-binding protein